MRLDIIQDGEFAQVIDVCGQGPIRARLMDMGFSRGTTVEVIRKAPMGGPIEVRVKGTLVSLRPQEAMMVEVAPIVRRRGYRHRGRRGFFRGFMNFFENGTDGDK
ncbi:MAG TPA: ferrous iron transport protein A [candidate division Zixibacteria bacterium]|nr:ferrous iron transport protein A [candidate division Zixibacteria bacterium]